MFHFFCFIQGFPENAALRAAGLIGLAEQSYIIFIEFCLSAMALLDARMEGWTTVSSKHATRAKRSPSQISTTPLPILQAEDRGSVVVKPSLLGEKAGLGLFAARSFVEGQRICMYTGQRHGMKGEATRTPQGYVMILADGLLIDAGPCPEVAARYANDNIRKDAINTCFKKEPKFLRAVLLAARDIAAGEELYVSYGKYYWPTGDSGRPPPSPRPTPGLTS